MQFPEQLEFNRKIGKIVKMKSSIIILSLISITICVAQTQDSSDSEEYYYDDSSSESKLSDKNDDEASSKVFSYNYTVENIDDKLFFNKTEQGDEKGEITGSFSVWRPDGKLMIVEYTASKEKGFKPKITIIDKLDDISTKKETHDEDEYDSEEDG